MKIENSLNKRTSLDILFGGCTVKGMKSRNDDAYAAYLPTTRSEQRLKGAIACVADGVGDSQYPHIASQLACENLISDYYSTPDYWSVRKAASKTIYALNDWFFSHNLNEKEDLSKTDYMTTLSCVVIKSNTAHIFHVGDSRVYRITDNAIEPLTIDQSYPIEGNKTYLRQAMGLHETIELTYQKVAVKAGDRFLLTTDGVHESLSAQQLSNYCHEQKSLDVIAKDIVVAALENGSSDNATALLVQIESLPMIQFSEVYDSFLSLTIPPVLKRDQQIDNFTVIKQLAKDARSYVYLVLNQDDNKQYILKAPSKEYKEDVDYMEGFALEHWLALKLDSPYLMKGYARTENSEYLYHISEYIQGRTLKEWMKEKAPVSLTEAQAILKAMIKCVHVLHKNNIVHRDLKPENFIFDNNGTLKLIDFGTVELGSLKDDLMVPTQQYPVGDIHYLAPEYLVQGHGSARSDLFSIAAITYELLTGETPYSAVLNNQDMPRDYEYWHYRSLFKNKHYSPYLPYWVDNVLKKALSPQPEQRYGLLTEFEREMNSPSDESLRLKHQIPLIQRYPIKFYQWLSILLSFIVVVQFVMLFS